MSANVHKRLNISDNFVVPYTANKSWDILSSSFAENNITVNIGINSTSSLFDPINEYQTNGQYDRLVYNSVNTIYYPNFLPYLVSTQSLQNTIYNDGTLSTSSYYNGHTNLGNPNTIKFYPTGNDATVYAINIPRSLTGDKILPTTFEVNFASGSNTYKIYDDGNYNLFYSGSNISSSIGTILSQSSYVGNVFYEQNIAILTVIPDSVRLRGWRGINPVCAQASPSPTPSITPTITVTPTISITPTITVTPTVTPTPTISITPTISVTPSVTRSVPVTPTPSKTLPPTVTPTPTISISPTPPPITPNIIISNISTCGIQYYGNCDVLGTIESVVLSLNGLSDVSFFNYDIFTYSFPLWGIGNAQKIPSDLWGTLSRANSSYSNAIKVSLKPFTTASAYATLLLYKNNTLLSTKYAYNNDLFVIFDPITWDIRTDVLKITYDLTN